MSDYFPTDVKLHFDGDKDAASGFVREARGLLFRAQLRQQSQPGLPVQMTKYLDNGGYISVELIDQMKTITISVPFTSTSKKTQEDKETSDSLYVLCGIKKGDSTVTVGGIQYLRSYRPSPDTARSHNIPNMYHDNRRLANTENAKKSSWYSGAMKRVVAAVEGLGRIRDSSGYYLTAPSGITRTVTNEYMSAAAKTHGIVKAGTRNHWLVEISAINGIIAMPLPLIPSTTSLAYRKYLKRIGDTGGYDICLEFGGLPSGETFPSGAALTTAISEGRVIRLATGADLSPFYGNTTGETHTPLWSWAFSDTGNRVVNTRYNYKQIPGDPRFSLSSELWTIRFNFSTHNKLTPKPSPVGTGSYTMTLEHSGKISKNIMKTFWAGGESETTQAVLYNYYVMPNIMDVTYASPINPDASKGFGCVLYAFYRGDTLELVKYTPGFIWANRQTSQPTVISTEAAGGYPDGAPYYQALEIGWTTYSPDAIISTSVDHRKLNASYSTGITGVIIPSSLPVPPQPGIPAHWEPNPDLDELLANITWDRGFGAASAPPNTFYQYFAIIPGYCREGVILNRIAQIFTDPEYGNTAFGVFDKLGVINIPSEKNFALLPSTAYNFYFSAVINPGPTAAYVMPDMVTMQGVYAGRPDGPPNYTAVNVFANTAPISTRQTTFIGSF